MGIENLDRMFRPKTVAIVGADDTKGSIGFTLMRNLIQGKYVGEIFPVHPHHKTVWKLPARPSIRDIGSSIDLAVIAAPLESTPHHVDECAKARVGGVVIIASRTTETPQKIKAWEKAIRQTAQTSGLRIIGPNCSGIFCSRSNLNATTAGQAPLAGKIAFLSQSRSIYSAVHELSVKEQIGFSTSVSLGSMLDVNFSDMIDYLCSDSQVNSILIYMESLNHFRSFMSAARAASRVKPIIVLKAGRTRPGATAAASHIGALVGEDAFYEAAFKRAGIVRVKTFEELFDCAELLSKKPRPRGPGLGIISNAGGPAVMATDVLSDYGLKPACLAKETVEQLNPILPVRWSRANPIDMLGKASPEIYRKVVEICLEAHEFNSLLIIFTPPAAVDSADVANELALLLRGTSYPVFTSWLGGESVETGRSLLNRAGIPTFDSPERAVRAFVNLYRYTRNMEMLQEIPPKLSRDLDLDHDKARRLIQRRLRTGRFWVSGAESKSLISAYGIPVNPTKTAATDEEAVQEAKWIGYPVAMKIDSTDIPHKTAAGGVRLNLEDPSGVRMAFRKIMENAWAYRPAAEIQGVTIETMLDQPGCELRIGTKNDRDFGPVILFGMGGGMTDVIEDRAIALPPLNRLLARRLMEETRVFRLLDSSRNHTPAILETLEEILIRLSQLTTDFPEIDTLDINPLIVTRTDAVAVDARVLLKPSPVQAPLHLIISPYPNQYECHTTTKAGEGLFVRPIRPEDAPLLTELFESLSPRSIRRRFFAPIKRLSSKMLARFTQIDYDREIALVALRRIDSEEKMLGVARVMLASRAKEAEFAIMVGDSWQGTGIGAELLQRCLTIARERNVKTVFGYALEENSQILALGRKLGFHVEKSPDSQEYELRISL